MATVPLDSETYEIIWDSDGQKGTERVPDLAAKKSAILAAAGFEPIDGRGERMKTVTLYPAREINLDYNGKITTLNVISKDEFGVVHGFLEEDETVRDKSGSMIETGKVIRTPVSMSLF